ncbi:uncharacterized protein LOC115191642 isoform X1 [Salmo trutta]|uniref:uncharacterized protein LOC115191642 isoform X1 n=1 Tax=Salmo trutta TaxID=8032 RepID=UPI0011301592|nr:uncharacterized protein LOC115191642 isoform X1 [Salmo trutta]
MDTPPFYEEGKSTPEEKIRPGEVDCDICSEVQAVKFCLTCSVSYCETHVRKHYTVPKLQRHTLVEVTGDLEEKLCQHDYSPLEVFCRTDQMLICSQCAETNHKGHDTILHEIKKAGRQSCDGDQHAMLASDDVLPAPDQLTVDSVDTTSAAVSWSQPPGLDQTQHHYQISYHCPGTERHITTTSSHSITLSDLQRGTQYSVTVCTVLENGKQSQPVSTTLNTVHFQWWKRPSRVAAVCVLLAVIPGLLEYYAEIDQLQNSLNTRTTERDQLQTRLRFYEKPCLDGWWKFGTSCYYVSSTMETGRGGQKECRAMGADDVIINSREEQVFINGFKKNVWIGALKLDGVWKWVDNTPFNTTYWIAGEPNNLNDKCVEISQTASDPLKSWRAAPCTSNYWVCEKPSTP